MDLQSLILDNTRVSRKGARFFLSTPVICTSEDELSKLPGSTRVGNTTLEGFKNCLYKKLDTGETVYIRVEDDNLTALVVGCDSVVPTQSDSLFQSIGDKFNASYPIVDYVGIATKLTDINSLGFSFQITGRPCTVISVVKRDLDKDVSHFALLDKVDNTVYDYNLKMFGVPFNKYKEDVRNEYWVGRM